MVRTYSKILIVAVLSAIALLALGGPQDPYAQEAEKQLQPDVYELRYETKQLTGRVLGYEARYTFGRRSLGQDR